MPKCKKCSRILTYNEVGLYKRIVDLHAKEFLCKTCLADFLDSNEEYLDKKIKHFIRLGCTLFMEE